MPAIAGLGAVLGGVLGKAIMGDGPPALKTDSSIAGIQNADLGKSPSTGLDVNVAQVNSAPGLAYFQQAADVSKGFYQAGLALYNTSIEQAKQEIQDSYSKANKTLAPIAAGGVSAYNEMLKFMGIDPMPATAGLDERVAKYSPELAAQLKQANSLKDPAARAEARQSINSQLQSLSGTIAEQQAFKDVAPTLYQGQFAQDVTSMQQADPNSAAVKARLNAFGAQQQAGMKEGPYKDMALWGLRGKYNAAEQSKVDASQQAYNSWLAAKQAREAEILKQQEDINSIAGEFGSNYTDDPNDAYTGQEVTDKLRATPGYQFRMDQGREALERSASAKGNLMSGNTLAALTDYGQGVADQTFQSTLANLASIASMGLPANSQIAENQIGEGANMASLNTMAGSVAGQTFNTIGNQYATSLTNQGQGFLDVAKFNADWQNKAMFQDRDNQAKSQQQAMASTPGIMNAQTAQAAQNYGIFQNQQAGAAANGKGSGWNVLPIGGTVGGPGNPAASYKSLVL